MLAVTLVAVTLCARQGVQAAPNLRPTISTVARKLAQRLTVNLRHVVPVARFQPQRQSEMGSIAIVRIEEGTRPLVHARGMVFQFRLPPPVV